MANVSSRVLARADSRISGQRYGGGRASRAALVAGATALFFFRPTSLVLLPFPLLFLIVELAKTDRRALMRHAAVVVAVGFLLPMSWRFASSGTQAADYQGHAILYGLLKQA